jgi:hypothetical protein
LSIKVTYLPQASPANFLAETCTVREAAHREF